MIGIIRSSKSICGNRVAFRCDAVSSGSSLSPNPASSDVVMVEVSPKVILSTRGFGPIPCLLNFQVRTVHVRHVPSISELGEFGTRTKSILTHVVSCSVAGHVETANRVSESNDTASPALVEGLIGIVVGSEVGVVVIEGAGQDLRVDDAGHWKFDSAGSISKLWVTSIAGHSAHIAVLLLRPNGCLKCESFLNHRTCPVIRVVLRNRVRGCGAREGKSQQRAQHYCQLTC